MYCAIYSQTLFWSLEIQARKNSTYIFVIIILLRVFRFSWLLDDQPKLTDGQTRALY